MLIAGEGGEDPDAVKRGSSASDKMFLGFYGMGVCCHGGFSRALTSFQFGVCTEFGDAWDALAGGC